MSLVLAIEPDPSQGDLVRHLIRDRVSAELVLVTSKDDALTAIDRQKPDLILVSALLSPRDEDELVAHLRALDDASHLQTLTIPQLRRPGEPSRKSSFFDSFRRRRPQAAPSGCDPKVFAEEVLAYLARAREVRHQRRTAAEQDAGSRVGGPPPLVTEERATASQPNLDPGDASEGWWDPTRSEGSSGSAPAPGTQHAAPGTQTMTEPIDSIDEPVAGTAAPPLTELLEVDVDSLLDPERAMPEPPSPLESMDTEAEIERLIHQLGVDGAKIETEEASESGRTSMSEAAAERAQPGRGRRKQGPVRPRLRQDFIDAELPSDVTEVLGLEVSRVQAEAETRLAAELDRVRTEAERKRIEELAQLEAEAEALRQAAVGQARMAAEAEAREALAAELARMRAEAEETFADALNRVRTETEQTLSAELSRARVEAEQVHLTELARVQAEADQRCDAAARQARETAEAEAAAAFAAELAQVRAEAEQTFAAELSRVRTEAEQTLTSQLGRARSEAEAVRLEELARAEVEVSELRTAAAQEARAAAEAAAAQALEAEAARVRAEAEARLEAELERVRKAAEDARVAERSEAEVQAEKLREAAAHEARAIAETAASRMLEAEIARVRAEAEARLAAELTHVRAEADERRAAELEEIRAQVAEMREAAAEQARSAAAEAIAAEVARAAAESKQTVATRTQPNVVMLRTATPSPAWGQEGRRPAVAEATAETRPREAVGDRSPAPAAVKVAKPFDEPTIIALAPDALPLAPKKDAELLPMADAVAAAGRRADTQAETSGTDYYSLWRAQTIRKMHPRQETTEEQSTGRTHHARWVLPIAASLLLVITDGMWIDTTSWQIGAHDDAPIEAGVVVVPEEPAALPAPEAPKPAPPKRRVGEIRVETTPAARVILDGEMRGVSPLTLSDIPAGQHTLVLDSDAGAVTRDITVRDGEMTTAVEAIIPGWLAVFSRIQLDIYLSDRRLGTTEDGHLLVPPGHHEIQLVNDRLGYRDTRVVDIEPGEVTPYTVTLPTGIVHINAVLGAEVWIEGELVGHAPLRDVFVPIGTREIVVRHPEFGERRETVDIRFGVPTEVTVELTR